MSSIVPLQMDRDYLIKSALGGTGEAASRPDGQAVPIPDHQLLRCIGSGSYGEVWLARNMMGVYRAVKIVYRKSFTDQRPFERELSGIRRFEPISRSHEGFVDVLHVGMNEEAGYFYYVMELGDDEVSGQHFDPENYSPRTLGKEISQHRKLPLPDCLQLGLALSLALSELHRRGLVHRDVKPSNIIFVNGVPKLADIGLVAEVNEARSYVGTEGFIPPEGPGTAQADVYGLGKVLYEASTGMDRQDFPELPTNWDLSPDHDGLWELNEVILKACKPEPANRYQSAWEMHADLLVVVNGKSVKRLRLLERRLTYLKRIGGIASVCLLISAAIGYHFYRESRYVSEMRHQQVGANVARGTRAVESADLLGALPYYSEALELDQRSAGSEILHRLRLGSVLDQSPKLVQIWFAPGRVESTGFSPDGQHVLVAQSTGQAGIFDLGTANAVSSSFGHNKLLWRAAYSANGKLVVTASEDHTACVWRISDATLLARLEHPDKVLSANFSPDSRRVITGSKDNRARIWDLHTLSVAAILEGHADMVMFAGFSPDGTRAVTTGRDNAARLWNAADGQSIGPPLQHSSWVKYAAFSPDGRMLATACSDHKACFWDLESMPPRQILPQIEHADGVNSVEFSPDGRFLLTACLDTTARLWLVDGHQPLTPVGILRHSDRVTHATFSSDGHRIVTACVDGTVRVWDLAGGNLLPSPEPSSLDRDTSRVLSVSSGRIDIHDGPPGKTFCSWSRPGHSVERIEIASPDPFRVNVSEVRASANTTHWLLKVLDSTTGSAIGPGLSITDLLAGLSLSGDGKRMIVFGGTNAQLWDVLSGTPLSPALSHPAEVQGGVFSRDGDRVATWGGALVRTWDASAGRELFAPLKHDFDVRNVEFSPDGSRLVTCGNDPRFTRCPAQVWDAATGRLLATLKHRDGTQFASFSPDGSRIATASEDFTAAIWEANTSRRIATLQHGEKVQTAAFSPDGKWVVTASSDQTARVWSAETGEPLTPALRHLHPLDNARFVADGRGVRTTELSGESRIWNLPVDQRSVEDLVSLATLLSGEAVKPSHHPPSEQSEPLAATWQRLRAKYPSDFTVTAKQVAAWHDFQAKECELKKNWSAAAFHLEHLLSIRAGDKSVVERLTRAQSNLVVHH